jgi:hypothetical protein
MANDPVNFMFEEQRGMVLLNPTNEDLDMQYSGVSFTIKSGQKAILSVNAANHVLNAFGPRGLSYLPYGANEEKVIRDGQLRNEDFKRRQVTEFNIRNENRKNMNLGYLPPTSKIKEYALELGLELMQPYAPRDAERVKITEQDAEIETLRNAVAELTAMVKMMTESQVKKDEANFVCSHCGKTFPTKFQLTGHMRSHESGAEKPNV